MNDNYQVKEIDLLDLIISFLMHWRSILIVFILFALIGAGIGIVKLNNQQKQEMIPKQEEIIELSSDREALVDEAVADYERIQSMEETFEKNKDEMLLTEQSEVMQNIAYAEYLLQAKVKEFSDEEEVVYHIKCGTALDTDTDTDTDTEINISKYIVVSAIMAFLAYAIIFSFAYMFDNKLKKEDKIFGIYGTDSLGRVIDWKSISNKKGLDKFLINRKYGHEKRIGREETLRVLSLEINGIIEKEGINSVSLIGIDMQSEENELKEFIDRVKPSDAVIISADNPLCSSETLESVLATNATIILARVGYTQYNALGELIAQIKKQKIKVLGVITYEG